MVAVDQAGRSQALGEGGTAVDVDLPALGLLEGRDLVERAQDGGVALLRLAHTTYLGMAL